VQQLGQVRFCDDERLEPALVDGPLADGFVGRVPADGVWEGGFAHERGEFTGFFGPEDQVEVVGHDGVAEYAAARDGGRGVGEAALEGGVVCAGGEELPAAGGAV